MRCLKVQRTRGSILLDFGYFTFLHRHRETKETITTPTNLFQHNELCQLIKNLNDLTDE